MNIYDLISRAQKLRKETQLDSVSPDRVGGLHEDTLKYINEFQLLASSPSLHKAYASVSAMQSDKSPKSDLTGKPLKPGQLVVIVPASQTDATAGDVYRYDGPSGNTSAWTFVAKIGAVPADAELSATSTNPPQNKVVTEKLTELESDVILSNIYNQSEEGVSNSRTEFNTKSVILPNGAFYRIKTNLTNPEMYVIWSDETFLRIYANTWYEMAYPSGKIFGNIRVFTTNSGESVNLEVATKANAWNEEVESISTKVADEIVKEELKKFESNIQVVSESGVVKANKTFEISLHIENGAKYRIKTTPTSSEMYVIWSDDSFLRIYNNTWYEMTYPSGKTFNNIRIFGNAGDEIKADTEIIPNSFIESVESISSEIVEAEVGKVRKLYSPNLSLQTDSAVTKGSYNNADTSAINIPNGVYYRIKTNLANPEMYIIWSDASFTRVYDNIWNKMTYPSGKTFNNIRVSHSENGISVNFEVILKPQEWEDIVNPNQTTIRALILGDSYSENGGAWVKPMMQMLPSGSSYISLAVGSATIRDRYNDRATYPYTSRPKNTDNTGNHNTLACQVEKLKRLMKGVDLDSGESAIYQNESEYPNVIIIEGGMNDNYDSDSKVATYHAQIDKIVENVYRKAKASDANATLGSVTIKTPLEEVDRTCFAGAYRYIADELLQLFPNAQIYITTCSTLDYKNGNPSSSIAMKKAEQQRMCSDIFAFNLIDWHRDGQINPIANYAKGSGTADDPYIYAGLSGEFVDTNDQLHPNARGGKKYGRLAALRIMQTFLNIGK